MNSSEYKNDYPNFGLFRKFQVTRLVGAEKPNTEYFVLDPVHDPMAREAVLAYAAAARRDKLTKFADDLERWIEGIKNGN